MARTIVAFTLCAFRTLMFDGDPFFLPPPPEMDYTPGPAEAFFAFMLAYLLLLMLILFVMPEKWSAPIIEVAFHLKGETK